MQWRVRAGPVDEPRLRTPSAGIVRARAEALVDRIIEARLREGFRVDDDGDLLNFPQINTTEFSSKARQSLEHYWHPDRCKRLPSAQLNRLVWRIGEHRYREAVPRLLSMIGQGEPMLDYCLAWALGRCGDTTARQPMYDLWQNGSNAAVQRMGYLAWFELSDPAEKKEHADHLIENWPAWLRDVLGQWNPELFARQTALPDAWQDISSGDWFEQLDMVAQVPAYRATARRLLLQQVAGLPFGYGHFYTVRRLYKAAEFRGDAELYGILGFRLEQTRPMLTRSEWVYYKGRFQKFSEVVTQPDFEVAFTDATRNYLRRRTWRTLRHLGMSGDPAFVMMALGVLVAFDDREAGKPLSRPVRFWDHPRRQWILNHRHYGPYSRWMLYFHLLHSSGKRWETSVNKRSWWSSTEPWGQETDSLDSPREEAFGELWQREPQALFWLLEHSHCAGVHAFAARILKDDEAFCAALPLDKMRTLLTSRYSTTADFGLRLAMDRITNAAAIDEILPLLCLMVLSWREGIRHFAAGMIEQDPTRYAVSKELIVTMSCAPDAEIRKQSHTLYQTALSIPGMGEAIVEGIIDWLEDSERGSGPLLAVCEDLVWLIKNPLADYAVEVDGRRLAGLLQHPCLPVKSLAADWLLLRQQLVSALPADDLEQLLRAEDPTTFAVGIRLFSAMPDTVLLAQPNLFAVCCTHSHSVVRRAILPALTRVALAPADQYDEFCRVLHPRLIDALLKAETGEEQHDDILACLQGPLLRHTRALSTEPILFLLSAQTRGAQFLGVDLLHRCQALDFSVREWARLGCNENLQVRLWAQQCYRDHVERIQAEMEAGLRIFDSRWQDTLDFATDFFDEHGRWTPDLLVALCDHGNPAVHAVGCRWLRQHLGLDDITHYLVRLSEHPSAAIQRLVAEWLEAKACDSAIGPEELLALKPYFLLVLSQVNRARQTKNRVLSFLRRIALVSPAVAELVADIFARQVMTVAIDDKAQYLEGLLEIREQYPQIKSVLHIHSPEKPASVS